MNERTGVVGGATNEMTTMKILAHCSMKKEGSRRGEGKYDHYRNRRRTKRD